MNRDQQKGREQDQQNKDSTDNRNKSSQDQMPKQSPTSRRPAPDRDDEASEPVGTSSTNQPDAGQHQGGKKQQR